MKMRSGRQARIRAEVAADAVDIVCHDLEIRARRCKYRMASPCGTLRVWSRPRHRTQSLRCGRSRPRFREHEAPLKVV